MKIEYLDGDKSPLPLVRLFEFKAEEINVLRDACNDLANGRKSEFAVHEQPWTLPVNGCRFIWKASKKDIGVRRPGSNQPLVLEFSEDAWREVAGKLSRFAEARPDGFNWLTMEGDVGVLISMDGKW